ncbi:hypothetical protein B0F90DRAFT_1391720 [Multifurca ochricompacta]|uniref:Uncharacterized protein n=1 Tax=Multifurca ochricompacta TaxID=376703 RepID=A0AAD4LYP2_9AGAM|nr:hypothetical protein B0F90DRAFT_1391720 [Multifurca ochricompacta]
MISQLCASDCPPCGSSISTHRYHRSKFPPSWTSVAGSVVTARIGAMTLLVRNISTPPRWMRASSTLVSLHSIHGKHNGARPSRATALRVWAPCEPFP